MSSDIDIEEHDVLEHPSIKKIFPDLSWIKSEIISSEDEEPTVFANIRIEATSKSQCIDEFGQRNDPVQHNNNEEVIIVDDVQCPEVEEINELPLEKDIGTQNVDSEPIIVEDEKCEDEIKTNDPIIYEIPDSECSDNNGVQQSSLLTKNTIVLGSNIPNKMIIGSNVPKKGVASNNPENSGSNVTKTSLYSEFVIERDPFSAKVILKDWGYILKKHPFYCDECLILFPSQSASNAHNASDHSLLVPIEEIEVVTRDSQTGDLGQMVLKCPICGYVFKTYRNYLAHIESKHDTNKLHPINEVYTGNCMMCSEKHFKVLNTYLKHISSCHSKVYNKIYSDIEPRKSTANVDGTGLSPPNKARKSTAKFDRMNIARKTTTKQGEGYKNIALKSTARQSKNIALKSTSKPIQPRRIAVKSTSKSENKTSYSRQSDEHTENPKFNYIICPICGTHYQHIWQYVTHCNADHQAIYLSPKRLVFTGSCECGFKTTAIKNLNTHISKEHKELFMKIATSLQEYFCLECDITFTTLNSYNIHKIKHKSDNDKEDIRCDRKNHQTEDFSQIMKTETMPEPKDVGNDQNVVIIPKDTIFKCPKCDLHSLSGRTVFLHFLKCTGAKSKVVCDICDRSLLYQDFESHKLQHRLMSTINDIEITEEAFDKLLLVCTECKVGFDSSSINTKHVIECQKKDGILCQKCNLRIAPECIINHEKLHSSNFDLLVVEFLCGNVKGLKEFTENKSLYYCHVCKSYDPAEYVDYHRTSVCLQNKSFRICRFCGLRFSHKSFADHILGHRNKSFDLYNVTFIDIHTGEVMKPKIPDWNKFAGNTTVKYLGEKPKQEKNIENTVYCEECQENYYELAYKIHLQYHEITNTNHIDAEIMQKYLTMQSLWNLVFLCQCCNVTFDNYDLAVEHSQDHIIKKAPSDKCMKCTKCNLIFEEQSFERHQNLHNGAEIDEYSFCVLPFNFEDLLSESWDNVFKVISDEQKSHILSKSVYNCYRNLRLELNYDGPSTHTLYKCAVCDVIVDKMHLLDHAYNKDVCKNEDKFTCSSCELAFVTRESLVEHESHHIPDTKTRIILFNKPKHFSLNVHLIRQSRISNSSNKEGKSKSSSTFYKCLRCEAGIQNLCNIKRHNCSLDKTYLKCNRCKLKYRSSGLKKHMLLHNNIDRFYIVPFKHGRIVLQSKLKLRLYECQKCKLCTHKRPPAHTCRPDNLRECSSCGLKFSEKSYKKHMEQHMKAPNLTRNNLVIIQYTPEPTSHETEISMSDESSNAKRVAPRKKALVEDNPMSRFLYKCTCGILFVKWNQLRNHVKRCSDDFKPTQCKCGLKFHALAIRDHLNVHLNCSSIKDYLVACVNVGKAAIANARKNWLWYCTECKTYYGDIKHMNCHFKGNEPGPSERCSICRITISSYSFEHHMELHNEDNEFSLKRLHKLSLRMISTDALKTPIRPFTKKRPTLYKCKKCEVHFFTSQQLQSHLDEPRHVIENGIQCNYCHYFFAKICLHAHKKNHHYNRRYKREDFVIQTNESADEEDIDSDKLEINESRKNRGQPTQARHQDFAKTPKNIKRAVYKSIRKKPLGDLKVLHKCGKCHLHFLVRKSIKSHLSRHLKTKKRCQSTNSCSICGLEFNTRSLIRHKFIHHKTLNLQVHDFEIRVYTSPVTFTTTRIKANEIQSKKRKIISDRVDLAKKMKCVPSPPKTEPVAASQPTLSNDTHLKNASQIFKCAECNVFFTNYVMCHDHTLNHKPLDNTEYIGCKLCDFQLLCECLGVHMKSHREGTFDIEDLLISEFRPGEGAPSIKTYLARDLLDANVISTTTNCS
ncbi:zinc finger protein 729 [Pieris rapae]|uniref:zinc finger protein 729 n=1 Tax=Pieris rapae TaxID=64459 RepID=UPI001E280A90|nr:zinc finger protein 729 [Pieris rapae]